MTDDPVIAHCREVIRRSSRSFSIAARLLPERTRHGAYLLYAWCRYCDDEIDGQVMGRGPRDRASDAGRQRARLAEIRALTEAAIDRDESSEPVFIAIGRVVREFGVGREHPFALLDGMAMDVECRRYATFADLAVYCYHVAGVVGVMMAEIMDPGGQGTLAIARDLGIAFQLTNTARDVVDDAGAGRMYLPLDWLDEAGVPADRVAAPEHRGAVAGVVRRLLTRAEEHYATAERGLGHLPFRSAWAIASARGIYSDIGNVVRRRGAEAWDRRAYVPDLKKAFWVGRGLWRAATR